MNDVALIPVVVALPHVMRYPLHIAQTGLPDPPLQVESSVQIERQCETMKEYKRSAWQRVTC